MIVGNARFVNRKVVYADGYQSAFDYICNKYKSLLNRYSGALVLVESSSHSYYYDPEGFVVL